MDQGDPYYISDGSVTSLERQHEIGDLADGSSQTSSDYTVGYRNVPGAPPTPSTHSHSRFIVPDTVFNPRLSSLGVDLSPHTRTAHFASPGVDTYPEQYRPHGQQYASFGEPMGSDYNYPSSSTSPTSSASFLDSPSAEFPTSPPYLDMARQQLENLSQLSVSSLFLN
jgi:hypothetical protein